MITRVWGVVIGVGLAIGNAHAGPVKSSIAIEPADAGLVQVRVVCDQNGQCWKTRYIERRDNADGGHYNGYYRAGPSVDLGLVPTASSAWLWNWVPKPVNAY